LYNLITLSIDELSPITLKLVMNHFAALFLRFLWLTPSYHKPNEKTASLRM